MRPSERRAAKRLKAFLEARGHIASYESGPDPPDIIFYVDGVTWAVEHTQLHQYVDSGNGELSRPSIDARAFDLVKRLRRRTEGQRESGWILALFGPVNSKRLRAIECAAEQTILKDDPNCFESVQTDEVRLIRVQDDACTIRVVSGLSAHSRIPGSNSLTAHIQRQIDYAVRQILGEKIPVLDALGGYDKRILLIESQYLFANPTNVSQSIQSFAPLVGVNLIFLVTDESLNMVGGLDGEFS
jgi:hypothetical protein